MRWHQVVVAEEDARQAKELASEDDIIVLELRRRLAEAEMCERDLRSAYALSSRSGEEGAKRLHAGFIKGLEELQEEIEARDALLVQKPP